ncbi:MAG: zinc-ribbon domain-containing protein [Clostridiaceae bacterium]|nr:zinc-ribbon domain-containing protein [Clostridiaceae bacterium]
MSFIGSIIAIVFGLFWMIIAARITANAPFGVAGAIFPLFGILFVVIGVVQAAYHYKNATGKDRFSIFDITDSSEEGDPAGRWIKNGDKYENNYHDNHDTWHDAGEYEKSNKSPLNKEPNASSKGIEMNYCPYCGKPVNEDFSFCPNCGKRLN